MQKAKCSLQRVVSFRNAKAALPRFESGHLLHEKPGFLEGGNVEPHCVIRVFVPNIFLLASTHLSVRGIFDICSEGGQTISGRTEGMFTCVVAACARENIASNPLQEQMTGLCWQHFGVLLRSAVDGKCGCG